MSDILVLREDLLGFAWSAPMRDLAAKLHMSDVGLKKLLANLGVTAPPQGYWNKLKAGKPVPRRPDPPPRRPGETGRIRVDSRFAQLLPSAPPMPSRGPFCSEVVPEKLDQLYEQELAAIGTVTVPKRLDQAHPALLPILKQEQRRREKAAGRDWHWDAPRFDTPLAKRRLRILNALFVALSRRGHNGDAFERDGEIHPRAIVGDTHLGFEIAVLGKCRTVLQGGYRRPAPDLPPNTPLVLRLQPDFDNAPRQSWQDDADGLLETKIAEVTARIIVAGETRFRRSLHEAEEWAERARVREEERRKEAIQQQNRERLQNLRTSGELLREAQNIRSLVMRVRDAILEGAVEVDASTLQAWERWALSEADTIDPVLSGQVLSHLATFNQEALHVG